MKETAKNYNKCAQELRKNPSYRVEPLFVVESPTKSRHAIFEWTLYRVIQMKVT